jgi:DNA-binding CsgD family transcriptional regulator
MKDALREQLERLLAAGVPRSEIARKLNVSASTVTRHARLLGYPDARRRPSPRDWDEVQAYYDRGHSIDECRDRFGFSYGAWDKAVTRGDLMPRPRANGELGMATRDRVEHLLAEGRAQAQICRELGLSKSTVAYHVRQLGVRADPRFARRYDWAEVQAAIDAEGLSMRECRARFGFSAESGRRAVAAGQIVPRSHVIPIEELLVVGRRGTNRTHLKARLVKEGFKERRCEECDLVEWRGRPLSLELHHVNGDGTDNRLFNLRILCPNCHSQTPSWGGRNQQRRRRAA